MLQNGLPEKFKDPKFKHENFITIHAIKIGSKFYLESIVVESRSTTISLPK